MGFIRGIRGGNVDLGVGRSLERLAPEEGLEPSTHRLTADCSTIELLWNARRRRKLAVGISLRQRAFVAGYAGESGRGLGTGCGPGVGRVFGGALRNRACARRKARGKDEFSRYARGGGVFAFNARSGTVPLPLGRFWGQATWGVFRDRLLGGSLGTGYLGNCENKGQAAVRGLGEFSVGLCGTVPALAGRLGGRMSFRAMREGVGCSPSMLAPARFRCRWVAFGDRLPGVSLGTGYLEAR